MPRCSENSTLQCKCLDDLRLAYHGHRPFDSLGIGAMDDAHGEWDRSRRLTFETEKVDRYFVLAGGRIRPDAVLDGIHIVLVIVHIHVEMALVARRSGGMTDFAPRALHVKVQIFQSIPRQRNLERAFLRMLFSETLIYRRARRLDWLRRRR